MDSNGHDEIHHQLSGDIPPHTTPNRDLPGQAEDARFAYLPTALRGRVPELWLLMLEKNNRIVLETTLLIIAFLTLFATVIGQPHRAEWVSFITAALAPLGFTVWYVLFPLNPYQTFLFTQQGLRNFDQKDLAASELVRTLSSTDAGHFLWRRTQRLWILFFLPMAIAVLAMHGLPNWAASLSWLIRVPIFCVLLFAVFRIEMLSWALRVIQRSEQA